MATNLPNHQYAGDARVPFAFGGSGEGRVIIKSDWGTDNLTVNSEQKVWKCLKNCYVSNFALRVTDMDSHGTPTLEWDVGTDTDDDEFIAGTGTTFGETGGYSITNVVDESTVPGFYLAAGEYIVISVHTAAATAAAGTTTLSFDVAYV